MSNRPEYKLERDVLQNNVLLPFTAKKEGKEWVMYSHNKLRIGTCNEEMAEKINRVARKWIIDNDIKPWEG